ncbi:MAM and LDL-receptor class a domain-containing protein, partial [Plakobranchus ocellatus]
MKGKCVDLLFSVLIAALLLASLNAEEETDDDFIHVTGTISTGRKFESTVFPESTQVQCVSYVALTTGRDPVPVRAFLVDAVTGEDLFTAGSHRDSISGTPTLFHFDLEPHTDPYQLVIEVDDGVSALVTVYDLEIAKGKCKDSDSSCDFEASTCQFTNNDVYKSSWERYRPLDDNEAGTYTPNVDADVGAVSGSYMRARVNKSSGAAELSTHVNLEEAGPTCIQFYFSIYGKGSLEIRKEGTKTPVKTLTNIEPSQKNINLKWKYAHVEIAAQESYVLSFLANPHQSGGESWMAIDDVKIKRYGCFETDQPVKPSSPPVNVESSCDFEGPCTDKWITKTSANGNPWTIRTGKDTNNEPHYDHTKGDPTGKFMYVWFPQKKDKEISVLRGPDFDRSNHDGLENCFSFWYYLHGPVVPRLSVYFHWPGNNSDVIWMTEHSHWPAWQQAFVHIPDPGDELGHTPGEDSVPQTLWSRSGGQGDFPVWRQARVDIPVKRTLKDSLKDFQLHLIGTVGSRIGADIAVDEISVHYNPCSDVIEDDDFMIECKNSSLGQTITRTQVCNFIPECPGGEDEEVCGNCDFSKTEGFCQYVDVSFGEILWEHSSAQPPELLEGIPRRPKDSPAKRKGDFLFVSHLFDEERGQMIARLETDFTFGPSPPTCQLRFSYFVSSTSSPALQVIIHQSAEETVIFSANSYMVSWATVTLNIGSIDAKFKIAFLGQKQFGRVDEGDVAIDDIQMINCEFPPIVDTCKPTESRCTRGSCVDVSRICDFNDDCGDQSDEEDCDSKLYILRTNFEEGFGEWTVQDDALTAKWLIQDGRAGQNNDLEPGRDHTVGNLNGHYMIKTRSNKLPSRLISPVLMAPSSSTTCQLRLYYYIIGTHNLIQLRVYTRTEQPGDEKLIFERFTSHGQAWTRADIEIEDTEHAFQIIIEGTDGHSDSVLALDDISLYGCMFNFNRTLPQGTPTPTPDPCPASKHRCQDGTCLDRSEVHECDFLEDCPDGSDEQNCDRTLPQGTRTPTPDPCPASKHRCQDGTCLDRSEVHECDFLEDCPDGSDEQNCGSCDFETNMCGWHDESLGIYSWVYRASSQQPQPSSDSTKDTEGKGHFMLLQTHSAGIAKDPALLLSPEFSETGPQCTFSFSYYTNVDHVEDALIIQTQRYDDTGTENAVDLPKVSGIPASIGEWTRVSVNIGKSATPIH